MIQEHEYQTQYRPQNQTQRRPEQQPYKEWDQRQQARFPDSPLAQYPGIYGQPYSPQSQARYQAQGNPGLNVAQHEREISVVAGIGLMLHALISRSRSSLITGPLGLALFWRGQTGHCPVYAAMEMNTAQPQGAGPNGPSQQGNRAWQGNGAQRIKMEEQPSQIEIKRAITVDRPAQDLYNFWRKLENLPQFMHHLEQVEQKDHQKSHWKAKIAGGLPVEWDAEIVEDVPGQRITWHTTPDAQVQQRGVVEFKPATGNRGTVVNVEIHYTPPGGIIGQTFGRLLNGVTAQQVKDDIGRFKSLMEAGEIATTEGQPTGR